MRTISENITDPTTSKLREGATHAAEAAREFGEAAAAKARGMTDDLGERSREIRHQVEFRVCEHPLRSIAAVFAAGFALGTIVLARSQCRRAASQS
jgi:ElaB/YqjD/DUF883 family membrane-anchored ribosome-binding protein